MIRVNYNYFDSFNFVINKKAGGRLMVLAGFEIFYS